MKTRVTEILGIEYPVLQGAMAGISECNLASAVSNAGGAGIIAAIGQDTNWLRFQIKKAKELTDKPFGVNIGLYKNADGLIQLICEEKPAFVTIGAGDPLPYIKRLQSTGIKVIGIIPNTRLAKRVEAFGIDMIIIEGTEAGGRVGNLSTMALMTNVIPEVKIPVIAAGAIADGRGLAAALVMGAEGIQIGTRFIASEECIVYQDYKEKILHAKDEDSVLINLSANSGIRGLKSAFSERLLVKGTNSLHDIDKLTYNTTEIAINGEINDNDINGIVLCGQGLGPIKTIKTVKNIIYDIVNEAKDILKSMEDK